ncbi:MAG: hypothetical protein PVI00_15985, partial [Desulfobacterales bacterium]
QKIRIARAGSFPMAIVFLDTVILTLGLRIEIPNIAGLWISAMLTKSVKPENFLDSIMKF